MRVLEETGSTVMEETPVKGGSAAALLEETPEKAGRWSVSEPYLLGGGCILP